MRPGDFDLRLETLSGDAAVVHVSGDLDLATAARLEDLVVTATASHLVLDLSECSFLDSAGMRALLTSARTLAERGGATSIVGADANVLRVLELAGVDGVIGVHSSLDEAL